jgi:hypothetical protein
MALKFSKRKESLRWLVSTLFLQLFINLSMAQAPNELNFLIGEFKVQKVERIKGSKRFYLITTTRADSTYLVYSKKTKINWCRARLRKGDTVFLNLKPQIILDENYFIFHPSPFYIENKYKIEISERFHYQLYFTKDLNGNCLCNSQ